MGFKERKKLKTKATPTICDLQVLATKKLVPSVGATHIYKHASL